MARPTTDRKGCTVILRINEETRAYLEDMAKGETISSYVRSMIQKEKDGDFNEIQNQPTIDAEIYRDIESMCLCCGMSFEEFMKDIQGKLTSGEIEIDGGEVILKKFSGLDSEKFERACEEKGVDPNKMIEKATQLVWMS